MARNQQNAAEVKLRGFRGWVMKGEVASPLRMGAVAPMWEPWPEKRHARPTQPTHIQSPDPQKPQKLIKCCFKLPRFEVICFIAIARQKSGSSAKIIQSNVR